MGPLVSIVLPIYNPDRRFLELALRSMAIQSYSPIEVIISDDTEIPSQDTVALIAQFKNELSLTYVQNNKDRGIFSNLNNAIHHSKGLFIQVFSQDDVMKELFIQNQVTAFHVDSRIGMVFSAFEEIDEEGRLRVHNRRNTFNPGVNTIFDTHDLVDKFISHGCFVGNISPVMIRRDVFEAIGFFNQELKYAADFEFWFRIGKKFRLYYLNEIGLNVRSHPERASHVLSNDLLLSDLKVIYTSILTEVPEQEKSIALNLIQKRVGASFVHHAFREVISFKLPVSALKNKLVELNEYPFNVMRSLYYYFLSIPGRIINKVST